MIFDGHSDIFADVTIKRLEGETDVLRNHHLKRLKKGGVEGSIFVIWIDPPYDKQPVPRSKEIMKAIRDEMAETEDFVIVHNTAEMEKAKAEGKFYIYIGLEGVSYIGSDVDKIDELYDFGARHCMLTWNETNDLATGAQGDPDRGLTEAGVKAVKKIQQLGMLMDVSHLNDKSFWDVMRVATGPVIASHSNARALSNAARNLTDDMLMEIKKTGGLVGMNSFNLFVSQEIENQRIERLVDHIVYISDKIGVEHVGFGFDFFEFLNPAGMSSYSDQDTSYTRGLEDATKVPELLRLMEKAGFNKEEMEAIKYKNWHNLIKKVVG
ncbi:MAG: membrane dipeptidase [Clostridiales bacterium]|nr:dipeptidase [Clostridiales bacterium]MDD7347870.1 membrane dipeptidase [Clostridiales bacterium]